MLHWPQRPMVLEPWLRSTGEATVDLPLIKRHYMSQDLPSPIELFRKSSLCCPGGGLRPVLKCGVDHNKDILDPTPEQSLFFLSKLLQK
ncbi:hypothetical protein CHARACLAT_012104 [Characodon lateralis]|uniref:Uncharacterized protein n=1 Tax=Characodon lateralis TaxID=208331 RepID=A0ABU7EIL2_9TELE|nr:hypothetical protein [Characodon lateralis]